MKKLFTLMLAVTMALSIVAWRNSNSTIEESTTVEDIGKFGFQTSVSERKLFANRRKGFMEAVNLSFDKVSPIILPIDLGGIV